MIGSFLTRGLVMFLGYAYPAYECYKTVEMNKPDIEQLRFWCQYWILVAMLSVFERVGDTFVSWVPMYSEAKLAFFIYLWSPKTKGTTFVYDAFFQPYISKHETEIDRNLLELRTRAGDIAFLYWQKAASYVQTRTFEILQYVASQSTPKPYAAETQGTRVRHHATGQNRKPTGMTQHQTEDAPSPSSSISSQHHDVSEEGDPAQAPRVAPPASLNAQQSTAIQTLADMLKSQNSTEAEDMQIEPSTSIKDNAKSPSEIAMDEAIRGTRDRLRRNRASAA